MNQDDFKRAAYLTNIIRSPGQRIHTFWQTKFNYFIISSHGDQAILRSGILECAKPTIITPETLAQTFQGFSEEAVRFAEASYQQLLSKIRILGYQFANKLEKESSFSLPTEQLIDNVMADIKDSDNDTAVLHAPNDIWGLSLMKVAFEAVEKSVQGNIQDLSERGHFKSDEEKRREEIEMLFIEAKEDKTYVKELGKKLQEYNLFEEYEDQFYSLV